MIFRQVKIVREARVGVTKFVLATYQLRDRQCAYPIRIGVAMPPPVPAHTSDNQSNRATANCALRLRPNCFVNKDVWFVNKGGSVDIAGSVMPLAYEAVPER